MPDWMIDYLDHLVNEGEDILSMRDLIVLGQIVDTLREEKR